MTIPSIPKGTRDFGPTEVARRNYIFNTIRQVFECHGFQPIETPAMENLSTLLGKYGDEGDKLLFKILNSGDFIGDLPASSFISANASLLSTKICEKGLRYDLTVPFARYVVQHRNEIVFPFRRYQIQPVWRADRPQKGRYREFYQCDADVIGSTSLLNEYELIQIFDEVFQKLQINVRIKINNRKILAGMAEILGYPDKLVAITTAIDKIEKIGFDRVKEELIAAGLSEEALSKLQQLLQMTRQSNAEKVEFMREWLAGSAIGNTGIDELETLLQFFQPGELQNVLEFDLSLARGLNYYTGTIFEVKALNVEVGSIAGGGRYDNLTGIFGLEGVSGVGISFGADRIYDVLLQLNKFPQKLLETTCVMFVNFGLATVQYLLPIIKQLRQQGVSAELYPEEAKIKKQFSYANARNIPYVAIAGDEEMAKNQIMIKHMASGNQQAVDKKEFVGHFISLLQSSRSVE
ncbi:MAG: histidine--tRNA ligase [Bacteroidales bacterium]|nr:histidine--tRNA ligase [Bacteroidales bacterium]HOK97694.1 histidine--tRNA ligase [Bacteroidales bacterium]HPO65397.1 histidine--tRNA ligase [Bacteroidales bacterium]